MIKTRLLKMLQKSTVYVVLEVVYQWLGLLMQIVIVERIALIISRLYEGNIESLILFKALVSICLAVIVKSAFDRLYTQASFMASVDVKRVIRKEIYAKVHRLGSGYKQFIPTSQISQMMGEGVEQLEVYFGKYISQFVYALLAPITLFLFLRRYSLKASVVLLVMVPLIPMVIMIVMKIAKKILDKYFQIYYGLGDTFLEKLQGMTTLKVYGADDKAALDMDVESERFRKITMKVLSMQLNSTIVMDIVAYLGAAVGILVSISEIRAGKIGLYEAILFLLLAAEFFLPMRLLGSYFHIGMNGMKAADRMFDFLDIEEEQKGNKLISGNSIEAEFDGVNYSVDEKSILKNISFKIHSGNINAIVGNSGSGKSTLVKLLRKQYSGYSGSIKINGVELKDIDNKSLISKMATVSLESYIFSGTVRDNLLLADSEKQDSDLVEVLKKVNLYDELSEQGGLDYLLKEGGSNLSGGQKQRLAVARALLKDCSLYVFDEATSNIDMESEEIIMKVIYNLSKVQNKTVILISHRLANVVKADKIFVMDSGRVVENGTHESLINQQGKYTKLYEKQFAMESMGGAV